MRKNIPLRRLAAASLLAAATIAAPAAFADDRGPAHGQYRNDRDHHGGWNDDHRDDRHDDRRDGHGPAPVRVVHEQHSRVVYRQPVFYRGRAVPVAYRRAIAPLPAAYRYRVAPPPRGYAVGYYQGYSVVYDPATYLILSVVDLLANG